MSLASFMEKRIYNLQGEASSHLPIAVLSQFALLSLLLLGAFFLFLMPVHAE